MTLYPAFLVLRERRCVVVGGGAVAEQKVTGLLEAGARVTVVSPAVSPRLDELAAAGAIAIRRRPYRRGDLAGAFLAIAATDDRAVNRHVWTEAEAAGVLLNAVDDAPHCSFVAPAVHRQGDLAVAVSTAGKSPALAVRLRDRIAGLVGPEYGALLDHLGDLRPEVARRIRDPRARTRFWYRLVDRLMPDGLRAPAVPRGGGARGVVYLVGAGPGDPGLITRRGLEILRTADVIVYDRLVHPDLLREAPERAERRAHAPPQEAVNALLIERARAGRVVVRLKGGDPFVFGRGGEEARALQAAGVRHEVVPGVTSVVAAPAAAGIPLTDRSYGSAFAVVTGRQGDAAPDLDWAALARLPALVVVMGLRALPEIAARLMRHGVPGDRPAAVIASATLPNQRTVVGTLAGIADQAKQAGLGPPATLVVGEVVGATLTPPSPRLRPAAPHPLPCA
ncbi:MAG TPA: siroheme synthase CysG [Gemmatimonadales bacterium]|nr:siroheme synthase CysG [Gemmatimonadales bacterium]